MMKSLFLFLAFTLVYAQISPEDKGETGFITVHEKGTEKYQLFYWLFKPQNESVNNPPIIFWLEGGPGCSSLLCVFRENGPYRFKEGEPKPVWNKYTWSDKAYLLYIDQPLGTGYSNCSDTSLIPEDQKGVSKHLMIFLEKFFEKYPLLENKDFYVTGHSYGGHYVPYFTHDLLKRQSKTEKRLPLNLKGVAIGNGFFKGSTQSLAYAKFNLDNNLYDRPFSYIASSIVYRLVDIFAKFGALRQAYFFFQLGRKISNGFESRFNIYNREMAKGYDGTKLMQYANSDEGRGKMGVGDRLWIPCSPKVMERMIDKDFYADMTYYLQEVIKSGLKVVLYSGVLDWICCTEGVIMYLEEISWEGKEKFFAQEWKNFTVNETVAGEYKEVDKFTFYKVYNAGHMTTIEKPEVGTYIIDKLTGQA